MKDWGDAKRLIFEDILLYFGIIFFNFGFDLFCNFMHAVNLRSAGQLYNFGVFQFIVLIFSLSQLVRKVNTWKYYA